MSLSFIFLTIGFVPLLGIAVMIKVGSRGPVIFRQKRPGKDAKIFQLYKFRTMKDIRDAQGNVAPDEKRITNIGRLLRQSSVDELPELLNVLKGDMSIVGPRPLLVRYLSRYTPEQARRHKVRPGLTGWAQVRGRNALTWEEKFKCDLWYIDNWSLWLDIKIIFMTIIMVLKGEGVSQLGHATMEEFRGEARTSGSTD